jgi:membrane protein YdbS with pleckstrin-like domain
MYNQKRDLVLRWLKVPPEPHPPFGDPASLRVFRAGRNFYKLKIFAWAVAEFFAFLGILFWALVFVHVEETARIEKARRAAVAQAAAPRPATLAAQAKELGESLRAAAEQGAPAPTAKAAAPDTPAKAQKPAPRKRVRVNGWQGFMNGLVEIALRLPPWAFPLLWALKIAGLAAYLLQLPLTYAIRRLDYEMRWYIVTDRSLRIRTGVWRVQESTMSFANLQQVEVTQGPLQRLLGLADLKVQSAGGSEAQPGKRHEEDLHTGYFHGVDNAHEIRDLILERLRNFRDSGLGDPEEARRTTPPAAIPAPSAAATPAADVLAAARELAAEARALRLALD